MNIRKKLTIIGLLYVNTWICSATPPEPIFQTPGKVLFEDDFGSGMLSKQFKVLQKTQWDVKDGILVGQPAPMAYQKSKPDHNGVSALIDLPLPEQNVILQLDVKFEGKELFGGIEFGHHVSKISFSSKGISVAAGSSKDTSKFKPELGKWYSMVGEVNGDELVVTIDGIKTFYVKDEKLKSIKKTIRIRGPKQGTIHIDNMKLSIASGSFSTWNKIKTKLVKK